MVLLGSPVDVKDHFGSYDVKIEMNDGSEKMFFVIYTKYNGVVIEGYDHWGNLILDQQRRYKNDQLEVAISKLFQPK